VGNGFDLCSGTIHVCTNKAMFWAAVAADAAELRMQQSAGLK